MPSRTDLLLHLIDQIERNSWQRLYRNKYVGPTITTWKIRLQNYGLISAPTPSLCAHLIWLASLKSNVCSYNPCNPTTHLIGNAVATGILKWGGVSRGNSGKVSKVLPSIVQSARSGRIFPSAPMNSGWTKVAAVFSYYHRSSPPQVIWDSRVSLSVCHRLVIAAGAYCLNSSQLTKLFPNLGWVPGRGGNRPKLMKCVSGWFPNRYGHWSAHVAGGQVAYEIAQLLNAKRSSPGPVESQQGEQLPVMLNWTPWLVACVLFMDGQ
jgi:hypothetical protein